MEAVVRLWAKRYSKGFNDRALGKAPEIEKGYRGRFVSIFDMGADQVSDEGYLAGYEDSDNGNEEFSNKPESKIEKEFQRGYLNGFQDRISGKAPEIKQEEYFFKKYENTDIEAKRSYRAGYLLGYKHGK